MTWSYSPGTVLLDKYRVESVIGRGGMAIVLRATHLQLGEEVALKILSPTVATPDVIARFLREAQALVRLRGEHVARVFDVGRLPDGAPYTVMEYLRGVDLAGELRRCGRQDVRTYRFAATYACAAHDAAAAKQYYSKVPSQFQMAIVQRCQLEGIPLP